MENLKGEDGCGAVAVAVAVAVAPALAPGSWRGVRGQAVARMREEGGEGRRMRLHRYYGGTRKFSYTNNPSK